MTASVDAAISDLVMAGRQGSTPAHAIFANDSSRLSLSPNDRMLSKLKARLRSAGARTLDGPIGAMGDVLRAVRPADLAVRSRHGGCPDSRTSGTLDEKPLQCHTVAR